MRVKPLCAVLIIAFLAAGVAVPRAVATPVEKASRQGGILLDGELFDWVDIVDDSAVYRWSAEVKNDTDREVSVSVILELLNDDDQAIHSSSVEITLQPGQERPVQRRGSLGYDAAADVVSFRFRVDAEPSDSGAASRR